MRKTLTSAALLLATSCSLPLPSAGPCPTSLEGLDYSGGWWHDQGTALAWGAAESDVPPAVVLCDDSEHGTFTYRSEPEPIRDADGNIIGRNWGWDRQEFAGYDYPAESEEQ